MRWRWERSENNAREGIWRTEVWNDNNIEECWPGALGSPVQQLVMLGLNVRGKGIALLLLAYQASVPQPHTYTLPPLPPLPHSLPHCLPGWLASHPSNRAVYVVAEFKASPSLASSPPYTTLNICWNYIQLKLQHFTCWGINNVRG